MDRDKDASAVAARSNNGRRPAGGGGLVVSQENRRPLFGNAARQSSTQNTATAAHGRSGSLLQRAKSSPGPSSAQANASNSGTTPGSASPGGSRIPRLGSANSFANRRPMSLAEAYKLAEGEEDDSLAHAPVDGSPSPAPRPWRNRAGGAEDRSARKLYGETPSKSAAAELKGKAAERNRLGDGSGKARTSHWVMQSGQRDAGNHEIPDLVPGIEDVPIASVETSDTRVNVASPEKSYAWQVDEDFTAGDLQMSDSPRIRVQNKPFAGRRSPDKLLGSRNTKLDEIRARELGRTKLDEIRLREQQAEIIPTPQRPRPRIGHTKLDDIRKLELEGLSKRAIAASKLEEIKEKNAMYRSVSPEEVKPRFPRSFDRPKSTFDRSGQRVPDTPVTIYKNRDEADAAKEATAKEKEDPRANGLSPERREQSRDLLRRLARAASSSPAPDNPSSPPRKNEQRLSDKSDAPRASSLRRTANNGRRTSSNSESTGSRNTDNNGKPTVGFTGLAPLSRSQSNESGKSKRSSMHSEQDPTDRIAGEAKLFAPLDNYSERGSVRAPSPLPDEEDRAADATPKPNKPDPLSMATPRVTGAYVETPVTVKAENTEISTESIPPKQETKKPELDPATVFRDKKTSLAWRNNDEDAASDPGSSGKETKSTDKKPRSRSLPRKRPPVKNSAKPPSVRDDLLELQRLHNIDDDTIDNLEEILSGKKVSSPKLQELLQNVSAAEDEEVKPVLENLATEKHDDELAMYEKLGESFKTGLGLIGARKDKKSEKDTHRQKDEKKQVANETPEKEHETEHKHEHAHKHPDPATCPLCTTQPTINTVAYVHFPLPRLFHRAPTFRLTLLGLLLCAVSLWYAAESAMCAVYCRPATCSGPAPCVWSFDDPTFGSALPIKFDQWTTGGYGRAVFTHVSEEVLDWAADIADQAAGRSIEDVDVEKLTFTQRRRHRRRLEKRGLLQAPSLPYEQRAKWESWRRERLAQERAREAREMGYSSGYEEESFDSDERIW